MADRCTTIIRYTAVDDSYIGASTRSTKEDVWVSLSINLCINLINNHPVGESIKYQVNNNAC